MNTPHVDPEIVSAALVDIARQHGWRHRPVPRALEETMTTPRPDPNGEYELPAHPPAPGPVPPWPLTPREEGEVIARMRPDEAAEIRPADVPDDLIDLARQARDTYAATAPPGTYTHEGLRRAILAAVLPVHERQVREQTLRDLDAGAVTAEDLAAAGLDLGHMVDLRTDGWTIQHPLTCRTDLFACPVNRAAERDLTGPPHEFGRFECGIENGEFWISPSRC